MDLVTIVQIASPLITLGAVYGGIKVGLNGTRERVKRVEQRTDEQDKQLSQINTAVARVETKQDIMLQHLTQPRDI